MEKHHQAAIDAFLKRYKQDETILAVLLGGSLAHGFAVPNSDIDLVLIVSPGEFKKRKAAQTLTFTVRDICTYENGYIDCKVIDLDFLRKIVQRGSDPARFAFKDNVILYSK